MRPRRRGAAPLSVHCHVSHGRPTHQPLARSWRAPRPACGLSSPCMDGSPSVPSEKAERASLESRACKHGMISARQWSRRMTLALPSRQRSEDAESRCGRSWQSAHVETQSRLPEASVLPPLQAMGSLVINLTCRRAFGQSVPEPPGHGRNHRTQLLADGRQVPHNPHAETSHVHGVRPWHGEAGLCQGEM